MKTIKVLLLGAVVAAFTFTSYAQSGAAAQLLSPRAQANQIKHVSSSADSPTITIAYVDSGSALLSPRAQANQIKVVKGTNTDVNPALICKRNMIGSPKQVAECASHTTMPGCQTMTVAPLK
jgi:uncharacterized protein (UPF0333 family)